MRFEDLSWMDVENYLQGFKRLLFVNGHGGNEPARALLYELANELPGLKVKRFE